jgi:DNA-binding MarR family transcriptional regulator
MNKEKNAIFEKMSTFSLVKRNKLYQVFSANGIYPGQFPILVYIVENEGCTQTDIAKKMGVSPASIALSTRRLQKAGLIHKKADECNLRCNMLFITEKGQQAIEVCQKELNGFLDLLFGDFSQEDIDQLGSLLDHMIRNMIDVTETPIDFRIPSDFIL